MHDNLVNHGLEITNCHLESTECRAYCWWSCSNCCGQSWRPTESKVFPSLFYWLNVFSGWFGKNTVPVFSCLLAEYHFLAMSCPMQASPHRCTLPNIPPNLRILLARGAATPLEGKLWADPKSFQSCILSLFFPAKKCWNHNPDSFSEGCLQVTARVEPGTFSALELWLQGLTYCITQWWADGFALGESLRQKVKPSFQI